MSTEQDKELDDFIETNLSGYWSHGAVGQDRLRGLVRAAFEAERQRLVDESGVMLKPLKYCGMDVIPSEEVREAIASLQAKLEDAEREIDGLKDQIDEQNTWPSWANQILKMVRERSGNDGFFDMSDGVDLPDEVDEALSELAAQAERANTKLQQSEARRRELEKVVSNFEISGPDGDGLVWLILNGNGTSGKAMFNLGFADKLATQVALYLEQDRQAAMKNEGVV